MTFDDGIGKELLGWWRLVSDRDVKGSSDLARGVQYYRRFGNSSTQLIGYRG